MCDTCCKQKEYVRKTYKVTFFDRESAIAESSSATGLKIGNSQGITGSIYVSAYSPEHAVFGAMIYAARSYSFNLTTGAIPNTWSNGRAKAPHVEVELAEGKAPHWIA